MRSSAADDVTNAAPVRSNAISEAEKQGVLQLDGKRGSIDPVVAYLIAATNGLMYRHLIGKLDRYPIPEIPIAPGQGRRLLDVGCSWGRWSLAAATAGYDTIGIDPSLGAVMEAQRRVRAPELRTRAQRLCPLARLLELLNRR